LQPPKRKISYSTANIAATVLEALYTLIPTHPEPPLTRISVSMMANSTTLDISAARNELGYQPKVSVDEGFDLFMKWWKEKN
jgi:nucleoside-diphosphate-sugar epimerase